MTWNPARKQRMRQRLLTGLPAAEVDRLIRFLEGLRPDQRRKAVAALTAYLEDRVETLKPSTREHYKYWLRRMGLHPPAPHRSMAETAGLFAELCRKGYGVRDIARSTGYSESYIYSTLRRVGLSARRNCPSNRGVSARNTCLRRLGRAIEEKGYIPASEMGRMCSGRARHVDGLIAIRVYTVRRRIYYTFDDVAYVWRWVWDHCEELYWEALRRFGGRVFEKGRLLRFLKSRVEPEEVARRLYQCMRLRHHDKG